MGDAEASPKGEYDTHETILYLLDAGHDVGFIGRIVGEPDPRLKVFPLDLTGVDEMSDRDDITARMQQGLKAIREWGPTWCLNSAGPSMGRSMACEHTRSLAMACRYTGPAVVAMHELGLPRVCIVTDPKCYPKEAEMNEWAVEATPVAVLSQEDVTWDRVINGDKYRVTAVDSGAAYWATRRWPDRSQQNADEYTIAMCAHSHLTTSQLPQGRKDVWPRLLEPWLRHADSRELTRVCGGGWDEWAKEWPEVFVGLLDTRGDVQDFLRSGRYCPMMPQKVGFATTKVRMAAIEGNCPLFVGGGVTEDGREWTYDAGYRVLDAMCPARIGDHTIEETIAQCEEHGNRERIVAEVMARTKPNFSKLDLVVEAMDDWALARDVSAFSRPEWLREFGGYVKLED